MSEDLNPYAAPESEILPDHHDLNDAEATRNKYLKHETNLKSFGSLNYLAGGVLLLAGLSAIIIALTEGLDAGGTIVAFVFIALSGIYIFVGRGLRTCNPIVKIPATILAILGLLNIPVGTLLSIFLLYLMFNKDGKVVLSKEYQEVMAATPHIKYKTPLCLIIIVAIFLIAIVAAIAIPQFA